MALDVSPVVERVMSTVSTLAGFGLSTAVVSMKVATVDEVQRMFTSTCTTPRQITQVLDALVRHAKAAAAAGSLGSSPVIPVPVIVVAGESGVFCVWGQQAVEYAVETGASPAKARVPVVTIEVKRESEKHLLGRGSVFATRVFMEVVKASGIAELLESAGLMGDVKAEVLKVASYDLANIIRETAGNMGLEAGEGLVRRVASAMVSDGKLHKALSLMTGIPVDNIQILLQSTPDALDALGLEPGELAHGEEAESEAPTPTPQATATAAESTETVVQPPVAAAAPQPQLTTQEAAPQVPQPAAEAEGGLEPMSLEELVGEVKAGLGLEGDAVNWVEKLDRLSLVELKSLIDDGKVEDAKARFWSMVDSTVRRTLDNIRLSTASFKLKERITLLSEVGKARRGEPPAMVEVRITETLSTIIATVMAYSGNDLAKAYDAFMRFLDLLQRAVGAGDKAEREGAWRELMSLMEGLRESAAQAIL